MHDCKGTFSNKRLSALPQLQGLTNQFNDLNVMEVFGKKMSLNLTDQYTKTLLEGMQAKQNNFLAKANPAQSDPNSPRNTDVIPPHCSLDKQHYELIKNQTEKQSFQQHFDIEKVITFKCTMCICYKLRNKRLILKQLPKEITDLQSFIEQYEIQQNCAVDDKIYKQDQDNIKLVDPWINLTPQLPYQNFVNCYGIMKKNNRFYTISDLIVDHEHHVSQKSEVNNYHNRADTNSAKKKLPSQEHSRNHSSEESEHDHNHDNPNQSTTKDHLSKQRKNHTIDVTPNVTEKELVPKIQKKGKQTFYGERKGLGRLCMAKNMYDMIKWHALGNLSSLPKIPEFYIRMLLGYIIQLSRTLSHAHKNGLVHGCFNLSKVVAQEMKIEKKQYEMLKQKTGFQKDEQFIQFDQNQSNYNFFATNFEPFQVEKILKTYTQQKKEFKKIFKMDQMKVDRQEIINMVKIKDVQAFANSIVEIMVGRCEEIPFERWNQKDGASKGITIDGIPLNWSKSQTSQSVFQILSICYGAQETFTNQKKETYKLFDQVHQIASRAYIQYFDKDDGIGGRYTIETQILTPEHQRRLSSAVCNNNAVFNFLNLTDESTPVEAMSIYQKSYDLLCDAIKLSPFNQVAKLNRLLLMFQQGLLRDDQFHVYLQYDLSIIDKELAFLIYILFKKNVQGNQIFETEYKALVKMIERSNHMTSNITKMLYDHPDFLSHKKNKSSINKARSQMQYIQKTYFNQQRAYQNHKIGIDKKFDVQAIFFSSNDTYMAVIGILELIIIDCRTGTKVYQQILPGENEHQHDHSEEEQYSTTSRKNLGSCSARHSICHNENTVESTTTFGKLGDIYGSKETLTSEFQREDQTRLAKMNENKWTNLEEKKFLLKRYPCKWESCVGNNGKQLILFDRAQQQRNSNTKFEGCRQEQMLVYTIVMSKSATFEPTLFKLNMIKLLDNEEVMKFGIDDYTNDTFGLISIVAKDLFLYLIDFDKQIVTRKISSVMFNPYMKSIYFNIHKKEENEVHFQHLKEFVEEQERHGNVVKMPKINEDIILIKIGQTNVVKIYNIKKREIVREFILERDEQFLEYDRGKTSQFQDDDISEEEDGLYADDDFMGKAIAAEENRKKNESNQSQSSAQGRKSKSPSQDLSLFEISPNASLVAAQFGNEILIKVLNQVDREQWQNTLDYHQSLTFLPIYLDEDYNFSYSKKLYIQKLLQRKMQKAFSSGFSSKFIKKGLTFDIDLTSKDIFQGLKDFREIQKFMGSVYAKNERIIKLKPFIQQIMFKPKQLFENNMKKSIKIKKAKECFDTVRQYQFIDEEQVKYKNIKKVEPLMFYDYFDYGRSNDYIKEFECTTCPKKTLIAAVINRSLQVYDFMLGKYIFKVDIPSFESLKVNSSNPKKSVFFADNDQLIVVQDGPSCLHFISIQSMSEYFSKTKIKISNEDTVCQLEGTQKYDTIDMGFGYLKQKSSVFQTKNAGEESQMDEADESTGKYTLNYDGKIDNLFYSRNSCEYGYIAVTSYYRFSIYYMYDEEASGSFHDLVWDNDYRFDPTQNQYGQHLCIDFDDQGVQFVSGTNSGYLCVFNLTRKQFMKAYLIVNPSTDLAEQISMIREVPKKIKISELDKIEQNDSVSKSSKSIKQPPLQMDVITYSHRTKELMITELVGYTSGNATKLVKKGGQLKPVPIANHTSNLLKHRNTGRGNITNLKIDQQIQNLIASFQNGAILVFSLKNYRCMKEIEPAFKTDRIYMDDFITYTACLDENKRSVHFSMVNWEIQTTEIKRPEMSELIFAREQDKIRQQIAEKLKERMREAERQRKLRATPKGFANRIKHFFSPKNQQNRRIQFDKDDDVQKSQTCEIF